MNTKTKQHKLLLDINISRMVYLYLKDKGYDAKFSPELFGGWTNCELARYSIEVNAVILTHDKHFHRGLAREAPSLLKNVRIIILDTSPGAITLIKSLIDRFLDEALEKVEIHKVVVISPEGISKATSL